MARHVKLKMNEMSKTARWTCVTWFGQYRTGQTCTASDRSEIGNLARVADFRGYRVCHPYICENGVEPLLAFVAMSDPVVGGETGEDRGAVEAHGGASASICGALRRSTVRESKLEQQGRWGGRMRCGMRPFIREPRGPVMHVLGCKFRGRRHTSLQPCKPNQHIW